MDRTTASRAEAGVARAVRSSVWAPVLVVAAYVAVVSVAGPAAPPWLDDVAHFCGGLALGYFFFTLVTQLQAVVGPTPRAMRLVSAVGLTAVSAIVWELAEFAADRIGQTELVPDLPDTLFDLVLGVAGALVFAAVVALRRRPA